MTRREYEIEMLKIEKLIIRLKADKHLKSERRQKLLEALGAATGELMAEAQKKGDQNEQTQR